MKSFSIKDIPEFSKKERIVVIGVIGKSPYRYPNKLTSLLPTTDFENNSIQCYWDERSSILYLHATTYMDTKQLTEFASKLEESSEASDDDADPAHWLVASGVLAIESCRTMALIFHICHIVVLSLPTSVFDLGYLQIFKAIDAFRAEVSRSVSETLSEVGVSSSWAAHGRACCPRLLFHFQRAPPALRHDRSALKRLEHAIEDQLYFILRKARIITNVCAKSLFAIPKNEEFVYITGAECAENARDVTSLLRGLVARCGGVTSGAGGVTAGAGGGGEGGGGERRSFRQFLQAHVDLALGDGFDDNVGKYAMSTSFFELPSAKVWRDVASALRDVVSAPPPLPSGPAPSGPAPSGPAPSGPAPTTPGALYDALATDLRFSHARCAKVLPIAQASYTEGLPSHYSTQHHAHKLSAALLVLEAMGRGPARGAARRALHHACCNTHAARRLCQQLSLTGHPCQLPDHGGSVDHSSGVRYVSACDCGRTKSLREDPYTERDANYTFYTTCTACPTCPTLHRHAFPVFQPSGANYRAAAVREGQGEGEGQTETEEACEGGSGGEGPEGAWSPSSEALSPGSQREEEEEGSGSTSDKYDVIAVCHDNNTSAPTSSSTPGACMMSRQPSTTEYLPGLVHTVSLPGLLPRHSSWSLCCAGASSLYSHALGLTDHLQPGFLTHTNYLTPWDCPISKSEQVSAWRAAQTAGGRAGRGKPLPSSHSASSSSSSATPTTLTVKIFIGFEYECPRGHRFMMSSPDTVMSGGRGGGGGGGGGGTGQGAGSGPGAALAAADMPVYAMCPCRGNKPLVAQCMRVHVVTPKAPIHVTLDPKVQPVPNGPIFIPQPAHYPPLKLSPSAYWVLRLPYVYADERGALPRPSAPSVPAPSPRLQGRIIAPMFGLAD